MSYEELVAQAQKIYGGVDASHIGQHIAFQFNITGEAEGAFYLEIADGKVHVEPYEYFDRDVLITTTKDNLLKIAQGELDPVHAYLTGKIKVEGNLDKALKLKELSVNLEPEGNSEDPESEETSADPKPEETSAKQDSKEKKAKGGRFGGRKKKA